MKPKTVKSIKITAGVLSLLIIFAAIAWIVALALLNSDIKTEVYGAEFDYVDDTMYDNAYITMKGGRWQLYRGGDAISRTFGSLEYVGRGRFSFINSDGKGWGIVRTDGSVEIEFGGDFQPVSPKGIATVGVKRGSDEFTVRNIEGKNHRVRDAELIEYSDFEEFYDAYRNTYVAYSDKDGKYWAVGTTDFEKYPLAFSPTDKAYAADGFLTVEKSDGFVTYGSDFKEVEFLKGITPEESTGAFYEVVDGRAVAYGLYGNTECAIQNGDGVAGIVLPDGARVIRTNGINALARLDEKYYYFDGSTLKEIYGGVEKIELSGSGSVYVFRFSESESYFVLDENCETIEARVITKKQIYHTKEKNRAQYTVTVEMLLADGNLYGYRDGGLKLLKENVVDIISNDEKTESRIITQTADKTEIFDELFRSQDKKTGLSDVEVIDAFLPAYSEVREGKRYITLPRDRFEVQSDSKIEIVYCTDKNNYFVTEELSDGSRKLYSRSGNKLGEFTLESGDEVVLSQNQYVVVGKNSVNVVSRGRKLNVVFDEIYYSGNRKYAVAVRAGGLTVINLNDGNADDERSVPGGIKMDDEWIGENTFVFQSVETGLYGIIDNGRMTLSPTFTKTELHNDFVIASVDGSEVKTPTYFQADFNGRRISKTYIDLRMEQGLTVGTVADGSIEITNGRGKVLLKNVTYYPVLSGGRLDFMSSLVYDEATGQTVTAVRKDNSRLLTVTANGYKRVISISRDAW